MPPQRASREPAKPPVPGRHDDQMLLSVSRRSLFSPFWAVLDWSLVATLGFTEAEAAGPGDPSREIGGRSATLQRGEASAKVAYRVDENRGEVLLDDTEPTLQRLAGESPPEIIQALDEHERVQRRDCRGEVFWT